MKKAIEAVKEELGGEGLLSVKTVRGYSSSTKANLVFRFEGMRFAMGIRQTKSGKVEFVGDSWGSENWELVQTLIERNYTALCGAIAMKRLGFTAQSQVYQDTVKGIMVEGMRT